MFNNFYKNKRVLVTGGAGFVGSHLVEKLVKLNAKVTVPVRPSTELRFLDSVRKQITLLPCDLFDRTQTLAITKNQDIVFHLAAAKGGGIVHSMSHHGSLFRDNIMTFINTIDAAVRNPVERFITVSSACVYPRDAQIPTPEEDGFKNSPEPTNAGYGWSKRMGEFLSQAYHLEFGIPVVVVRPFNAYGPRDDFFNENQHVIPGIFKRLLSGENPFVIWGSGNQTRTFLFVDDFVDGLLLAGYRKDISEIINLGSDEEISIRDLAQMILQVSEIQTDIIFDTTKPDGQPRRTCYTTRAKSLLNFTAKTPLREGLQTTLAWYRKELNLLKERKL